LEVEVVETTHLMLLKLEVQVVADTEVILIMVKVVLVVLLIKVHQEEVEALLVQ
jgi:hypothetical protein